jgi:hypothetical protein
MHGNHAGSFVELNLTLDGTSAVEYQASTIIDVLVASRGAILPPPKMIIAKFSNSGSSIYISFDKPTNTINRGLSRWNCDLLFYFIGINQTYCSWTNNTVVQLQFVTTINSSSLLSPNDDILMIEGRLQSNCAPTCDNYPYSKQQTIKVLLPDNALVPTVVISIVRTASLFDNLTVDASLSAGHGSRAWSYVHWTVSTTASITSGDDISRILNSYDVMIFQPITIYHRDLKAGTYTLSLTVENFMKESNTGVAIVTIDETSYLPL